MKKLLAVLFLIGSCAVEAHGYNRGYWVAPVVVGGVIGYEMARPRYYQSPSVMYVQPSPTIVYTQQPYAVMPPPAGYHYQYVTDPACSCTKVALVPN